MMQWFMPSNSPPIREPMILAFSMAPDGIVNGQGPIRLELLEVQYWKSRERRLCHPGQSHHHLIELLHPL